MLEHLSGIDLIYFAQADVGESLVRIGASSQIRTRWRMLCAQMPCRLFLLGVQISDDAASTRRELHAQFDASRSHGEWFRPTPSLMSYIDDHAARPEAVSSQLREVGALVIDEDVDRLLDQELPPLATVDQVATAASVCAETVRRHAKARNIPVVHVGSQLRFNPYELRAIITGTKA